MSESSLGRITTVGAKPAICVMRRGAGEAIVFLHGLGSIKENWSEQIQHFAANYFTVAWDARGYGGSEDYPGDLVFDRDFVADLLAVLDDLKIERAHLVGLSMGGLIAQCFYFSYPQRVATLVLADSFPSFDALGEVAVSRFTDARLKPLLDGAQPSEIAHDALGLLLAPEADAATRDKMLRSLSGLRRESYIKTIRALLAQKPTAPLETIGVPTLCVVGEVDRLSPVSISQDMARRIPSSQFAIVGGAGHMSNMECSAEFNEILERFLSAHSGRATKGGA